MLLEGQTESGHKLRHLKRGRGGISVACRSCLVGYLNTVPGEMDCLD